MEINLNDIPIGVAECDRELQMLKSAKLYKEIKKMMSDFNFLIVSMKVYNILEHHEYFLPLTTIEKEGIFLVGEFLQMKVYVDLHLHPNQILLQYDKSITRDKKLDDILNDVKSLSQKSIRILD